MGVIEKFGKDGNAFGIGVGLESETFAFEQSLELLVVGDNAIVDNAEFPLGVRPKAVSMTCSCVATSGLHSPVRVTVLS